MTDGGGNYTLSGLSAGPYSVWASKGGYAFSPRPLTVTLPPSAVGQNFVGIPKRPVIVISGTGGSANWPCFLFELTCDDMYLWSWTPTANDYYRALLSHLTAAGTRGAIAICPSSSTIGAGRLPRTPASSGTRSTRSGRPRNHRPWTWSLTARVGWWRAPTSRGAATAATSHT